MNSNPPMPQSSAWTKITLSLVFILAIIAYVVWQLMSAGGVAAATEPQTSQPSETTNPAAGVPEPAGTTTIPSAGTAVLFKDGSYTGKATDAFYGIVQVKAIVKNGKLADVEILQSPNSPGNTTEITKRTMPILVQEAISAQSAHVDIISGATQTSEGFETSLASALVQAKVS